MHDTSGSTFLMREGSSEGVVGQGVLRRFRSDGGGGAVRRDRVVAKIGSGEQPSPPSPLSQFWERGSL
jgi:hypothetical protein